MPIHVASPTFPFQYIRILARGNNYMVVKNTEDITVCQYRVCQGLKNKNIKRGETMETCPNCGWRKTIQNDNCNATTHVNNRKKK